MRDSTVPLLLGGLCWEAVFVGVLLSVSAPLRITLGLGTVAALVFWLGFAFDARSDNGRGDG